MSDWGRDQRLAAQAKHHREHRPNWTLKQEHAWAVEQSTNMDLSAQHRRQWKALAEELATRLPADPHKPTPDDVPLF